MRKMYAIVKPAHTYEGALYRDITVLFSAPFHQLRYEKICGYSLGHQLRFFDDKDKAYLELDSKKADFYKNSQHAIIEFEIDDNGKVAKISALHNLDMLECYKLDANNNFVRSGFDIVWKERAIKNNEASPDALAELQKQFNVFYTERKRKLAAPFAKR